LYSFIEAGGVHGRGTDGIMMRMMRIQRRRRRRRGRGGR
jgi:hypothetical protein